MMEKCFITGLACKGVACEGIYHEATQQCKIVMMVNRYLGHIDGPVKETPTQKEPLAAAMRPELTGIEGKIQQILVMHPNLTRESVERLIDEERAKAAGLLTEEAAAHLVASNLGLDRQIPDISGIRWMIKGNKDARDTDNFAYAFVFKYDQGAKQSTDELRMDAVEFYNYLRESGQFTSGDFTYKLSRDGQFFQRTRGD